MPGEPPKKFARFKFFDYLFIYGSGNKEFNREKTHSN
jgi:hypothetical protein